MKQPTLFDGLEGIELIDYSDKSLVITGTNRETGRQIADFAEKNKLWAKFNTALKQGENRIAGWVVSKKNEYEWREFVLTIDDDAVVSAEPAPRREAAPKERGEKGERSLSLNQAIYIRHFHFSHKTEDWDSRQYQVSYYKHGNDILVKADFTDRRFDDDHPGAKGSQYFVIPQNGAPTTWKKDIKKMLEEGQPYTPPDFIYLTAKELQPAYKYEGKERLQKHILAREVILGKLLVWKYRDFDGMQDMHVYSKNEDYGLMTRKLPYAFMTDYKPYVYKDRIDWGDYRLKPNPRKPNKKFYLFAEQQEQTAAPVVKQEDPAKVAEGLRKKAESLEKQAEKRTSGGVFNQNWTHRRQRQMDAARNDAERMEFNAKTLRTLADMWENGTLPDVLRKFRDVSDFEIMHASPSSFKTWEPYKKRGEKLGIETVAQLEQLQRYIKDIQEGSRKPENPVEKQLREIELKQRGSTDFDFFPTPESVANRMIDEADIQPGERILEPSAGLGHIAKLIREQHPDNDLDVIELTYDKRKYLQLLDFNVLEETDFLELIPSEENQYDKIIMNPPYSKKQAFKHVLHAYNLLAPGGRVVALMPANIDNQDRKFDEIMFLYGKRSERLDNAFKGKESFNQTGVSTVIVTIDKPFEPKKEDLYIANDGKIGTIRKRGFDSPNRVELLDENRQHAGYYYPWQLVHFTTDEVDNFRTVSVAILLAVAKERALKIYEQSTSYFA